MIEESCPTLKLTVNGDEMDITSYTKDANVETTFSSLAWRTREVISHYEITATGLPAYPDVDFEKKNQIKIESGDVVFVNTDRALVTAVNLDWPGADTYTLKFEYK